MPLLNLPDIQAEAGAEDEGSSARKRKKKKKKRKNNYEVNEID